MGRRKNLNDKFGFVEIMEVSLNEIGEIITGNTPSKSDTNFWNSPDICFIKPDVIAEDEITELLDSNEYISENARNKARIVNENSILVTCIGSIAKIGIVKIRECAFNQQINAIIPNKNIDTKYLCYCLQNSKVKLKVIANAPVVPIINKKQFGEFVVKIDGDISTQKKIVNRLDYIQSVITLYKIQLQKFDDLIKARFIEMFGEPVKNPKKFEKRSLKDTCKIVTGNTPSRAVEEYYGDFVEWIKSDNIISGEINPTRAVEYLSEEGMKVGRVVEEDAILMACIAGSIASIGRVCVTDRTVAFNQQINAIVPNDYNPLFLYVLLQISKDYLIKDVSMALKGILSKSKLEEKEFIVPPIELQNQFADFVHQVDKSRFDIKKSIIELEREVVYD